MKPTACLTSLFSVSVITVVGAAGACTAGDGLGLESGAAGSSGTAQTNGGASNVTSSVAGSPSGGGAPFANGSGGMPAGGAGPRVAGAGGMTPGGGAPTALNQAGATSAGNGNGEGGSDTSAGSGTGGTAANGGTISAGGTSEGGAGGALTAGGSGNGGDAPCAPPSPGSNGQNPLFTDIFTADPAPLVDGCTFYIAAGHDEGSTGFLLREWYVLSSTDMVSWTDNGGPRLALSAFDWADANAWAGQMVKKDEKFYWYVPINEQGGAMTIAVAVGDSPLGPFTDAIGGPLINDPFEMEEFGYDDPGQTVYTIDPTVLVDDDGQAYLAYGGFWRMVVAKLGSDMVSIDGPMQETTPPDFFEAPFLFKREGTYYLTYAAGVNPAGIDYATSTSPMGPWTPGGRILDPLGNNAGEDAATSHPGIAEFGGQWYLVYHWSDGPGGGTYRRQVAVEKLTFDADGGIEKITPSAGLSY